MAVITPHFKQEYHPETIVDTNDRMLLFKPRLKTSRSLGVIWCHGAGQVSPGFEILGDAIAENCGRLAAIGCTVLAADFGDFSVNSGPTSGPDNWGTPTATAKIESWRQWLVSQGVAASQVALLGYSMGGYVSLAYKRDFPSKVACVAVWNGFTDIKTCRDDRNNSQYPDWATIAPSIDAAWQIASTAPLPVGADLMTNTAIQNTPYLEYYCNNDPFVPTAWPINLAAWIGSSAQLVDTGNNGHFAWINMPTFFNQLATFINDNMRSVI